MINPSTKTRLLSIAAGCLLLTACQKHVEQPGTSAADNAPPLRPLTGAEVQTVTSANDFAFRAFGALRPGTGNLCISPLSISAALTMACNGADGTTKAAMKQTLGFAPQTDAEINESFRSLFGLLTGMDKTVAFTAANSIWYGQQYQLQAPFVQQNQTYLGATVRGVNFGAAQTKDLINDWVSTQTRGKISRIVEATTVDDVMYLINALYFKGRWTYPFDPQNTRPEPFFSDQGTSTPKDFMRLTEGKYLRYADAQQQVIDLPYGNRQFSMTLVVPQGTATLADVTRHLSLTQLNTWLAAADTTSLELHLPKFRLEYEKTLNETLTQLGMGEAFSESRADFSRTVTGISRGLLISEVKHKTFLEVNEEGTEAAAVTSVGVVMTSVPRVVLVNRPFVFLIREKSSNAILFIGQITNP